MNELPFIKLFKTVKSYYILDVNTTSIIHIDNELFIGLEKIISGSILWEQLSSASLNKINKLKKQGFLEPYKSNIEIKHAVAEQIENYIESNVHQLILQVTQNCNLSCKYCVYSGSYVNRIHTKKRMSIETAKKAIDFYHKNYINL